jgi:glycerol-3-phosphate acyltransferase PlsY
MSPDLIATGAPIIAYLLGSVCSAILVCRLLGLPDPRTEGSHIPRTTTSCALAARPAALTLLGDMLKAWYRYWWQGITSWSPL